MGRMRFRRARFRALTSVSFLALTEFRGASSVSSSQSIKCVPKQLTEFLAELSEFGAELSDFPFKSLGDKRVVS